MKNIVHWNTEKRIWTSHTYLGYEWAPVILINGPWETECKPEKVNNPKGWVVSSKEDTILNPPEDLKSRFKKQSRLIYDKEEVTFNINSGQALLFDNTGCYVLEEKMQ